jgi:hypothetical protein
MSAQPPERAAPVPADMSIEGKAYPSASGRPNIVTSAALADKNEERTW